MNKIFKYSILRYRPSYLLEEQVNIGVLFFFLEDKKAVFIHPSKLRRITQFYPDANLSTIRKYLAAFKQKVNKLNISSDIESFDSFIESNLLLKDASNLYFSTVKSNQYIDIAKTIEYYYNLYFSVYEGKTQRVKKDETYLKRTFKNQLEEKLQGDKQRLALFRANPSVKNTISSTEFDLGWQNGTTNLVKFLSFDLMDKGSFQEKSFRWYGELNQLKTTAEEQNLKVDLVLTKPLEKILFEHYDNAIKVLEDIQTPKKIIEEHQLNNYIESAIYDVKPLEKDYLFQR